MPTSSAASSEPRAPRLVLTDPRALRWAASFAIVLYGLNFGLGVTVANVMPAAAGFLTGLSIPFVQALSLRLIRRRGVVSVVMIIYGFAAIPTGLVGPQALGLWKVVVVGVSALLYDLIASSGHSKRRFYFAFFFYTLIATVLLLWGLSLFDMPMLSRLQKILIPLVAIYTLEGFLATFLALRFYDNRLAGRPAATSFLT